MENITLTACLIGASTTYCAFSAYYILRCNMSVKSRINTLLGWALAYFAITNMKDLVLTYPQWHTERMHDLVMLWDGWSAMVFAAFLLELTSPGWVKGKRIASMSLPFIAFTALYLYSGSRQIITTYAWFLGIFGITVIFIGLFRASKYIKHIKSSYSNIEEIDISWIGYLCAIAFFTQLLWLLASLIAQTISDCIYYASEIILYQLVVVHCRHLKPIEEIQETKDNGSKVYPFATELDKVMEEEKLFLTPNLTLQDLARRLRTNRTYLSNYFKSKDTTFYDYINSRRTKESVLLMKIHPEYTLDFIAKASGFNSVSTFRRAFNKFMGKNPSELSTE